MSVDTTDDKEKVVKKSPIETAKPSPSDAAPIKTAKPRPIDAVPIVATRAPVEIKEPTFQTGTDTLSDSSSTSRNSPTFAFLFSDLVPIVVTRAPI